MTKNPALLIWFFLSCLLPAGRGFAEVVTLRSGETLEGTIETMDAVYLVLNEKTGRSRSIAREEIVRIEFGPKSGLSSGAKKMTPEEALKEPSMEVAKKPASRYATPLATFETWKAAAVAGDIDGMSRCYISYRQADIRKDLKKLSKADFNRMRAATAQTEFSPGEPFYQGERATLEVNWRLGLNGESQVLQFTLDKNDWKLIP